MSSGTIYYANEKPERVYELLNEYVDRFPIIQKN